MNGAAVAYPGTTLVPGQRPGYSGSEIKGSDSQPALLDLVTAFCKHQMEPWLVLGRTYPTRSLNIWPGLSL